MAKEQTANVATEENEDYLDELAGQGYEGLRTSDYVMPFLRVLQANSPEVAEGDPAYVPGAKPGVFFNTLTKEVYGSTIEVLPIRQDVVWLEYTPKVGDKRGDFQGKHSVGSVSVMGNVYDGMHRTDNGNDIKETLVFYVLLKGRETDLPLVFSLTSSMIKHGKAWNSLIYTVRTPSGKQAAYFSSYWRLSLVLEIGDKGRWFNIGLRSANVERTGFVSRDVLALAANTRKLLDADSVRADFAQITDGEIQSEQAIMKDIPF